VHFPGTKINTDLEYFSGEVLFVESQVELRHVKAIQLGISKPH